jgi:hypothetical protein
LTGMKLRQKVTGSGKNVSKSQNSCDGYKIKFSS